MITIIAQKSLTSELKYTTIGNDISSDSWSQIELMINIFNSSILTELIAQESNKSKYKIGEFNAILIRYEDLTIDGLYIGFYDTILDDFWENFCEKKYGIEGFVWDEQTPMLRFSKINFEHVLKKWIQITKEQQEYLIITQDADNWIDIRGENELTADELCLIDKYKHQQEELRAAELKRINARNQNTH
jgi:hypothetical protein